MQERDDVLQKDRIAAVLICSMMLCGCEYQQEIEQFTNYFEKIGNQHQNMQEQLSEYALLEETIESESEIGLQIEINDVFEEQNEVRYYAYETLEDEQKALYQILYNTMVLLETEVTIPVTDEQVLKQVFQYVMNDHPELFYVGEWSYTTYKQLEEIQYMTFSVTYTMTQQEVQQYQELIQRYVEQLLRNVPHTQDEYEIVKYLYEHVIELTEYDLQSKENQNICSVFIYGRSVCQGYAKALQYLLQNCGIESYLVTGIANQGMHAWNLVKVNGAYYYVDATWGDASYILENGQTVDTIKVPTINYDYLLVTTNDLQYTHQVDTPLVLPECNTMTDNFYVREGLYLNGYDEEQLEQIFDSFFEQKQKYLTIKCSDDVVYQEVYNKLIRESKVFFFLENRTNGITYSENEMQKTLSFWI